MVLACFATEKFAGTAGMAIIMRLVNVIEK
jgi:hypothetical protein